MADFTLQVRQHYARQGIVDKMMAALEAAGKDPKALRADDLAPLDQMHLRGIEATREIARRAGLREGMRVLDVGSGLGGPARVMAAETGSHVVGVDLTPEFVAASAELSERLGLADRVEFHAADAAQMPFPDDSFDAATSMTSFMNMPDKDAVYKEVHRVLKPGARMVQIETLQGPGGEPHYPTLWARDASYSFLRTPEEMRKHIEGAGLRITAFDNDDQPSLAWVQMMQERMAGAVMGPHVVHGPEIMENMQNAARSLAQGRVTVAVIESAA